MRRKILVLAVIFSISSLNAKVLATVGQDSITQEDINKLKKQLNYSNADLAAAVNDDDLLNQLINIRLGIMDAKVQGMDQKPEAKEAMDSALFNYYRFAMVDSTYKNKKFTKAEILSYYNANPIIKLQRIAVAYPNNNEEKQRLYTKLSILRGDLQAKNITFEKAIQALGDDASENFSGIFDKIASPSLPQAEASEIKDLAVNEISTIIDSGNFLSIIKVLKKYPFSSENYGPINERLKMEAIAKARVAYFKSLRQKYSTSIKMQK